MILFNTLTVKKAVLFTKTELNRENTKTLRTLREWCGKQMTRITVVVEQSEPSETTEKLLKQRNQLNGIRIIIDELNGVSPEKIASRNSRSLT
jgi:hypothetical protein